MKVKIKKLNQNAVIPQYAKAGDAGLDLVATSIKSDENGNIVYGTGLAIEIPQGYVGLIFPRSSISKYTLALSNAVGVIDSGYRGEITAKFKPTSLFTLGYYTDKLQCVLPVEQQLYKVGDRIAQLIILPYPQIEFEEVTELSGTERGDGGYGSTGK